MTYVGYFYVVYRIVLIRGRPLFGSTLRYDTLVPSGRSVRSDIKNVDTCRTNISCTYLSYTGISYSITSHIPQLNVSSILCVNLSSINI